MSKTLCEFNMCNLKCAIITFVVECLVKCLYINYKYIVYTKIIHLIIRTV